MYMINIKRLTFIGLTYFVGLASLLSGCGDESTGTNLNDEDLPISAGPEIQNEDTCNQEYSICGYLKVPSTFDGTPRSLAVALYPSIPPQGPPALIVTQINDPSLTAGERYPIRFHPFLDTGEYYLWVNAYVEGGGLTKPVNGVDYTASSVQKLTFDGNALDFGTIELEQASGW